MTRAGWGDGTGDWGERLGSSAQVDREDLCKKLGTTTGTTRRLAAPTAA